MGPSRPQGVFVEASSSTTIDVKWSAPADSLFLSSFFFVATNLEAMLPGVLRGDRGNSGSES